MLYLKEDDNTIVSCFLTVKDKEKFKRGRCDFDKTDLETCDSVLTELFLPKFQKNNTSISLKFFKSNEDYLLLQKVFNSNLDLESKLYILKSINQLQDFYYFTFNILDNISFDACNQYNIEKLKALKKLSEDLKVNCDAKKILDLIPSAENNSKMLLLSQTIKNL